MFICTFKGHRSDLPVQQTVNDLASQFEIVKFSDDEYIVPWFPKDYRDLQLSKFVYL